MQRPEEEFWNARFSRVVKMLDIYADEKSMEAAAMSGDTYQSAYFSEEPKTITSMKEIEGFV